MTDLAATTSPSKDWKEKRSRRLMVLSASQFETFELCARKWWLKFVRGLPEPDSKSTIFGSILHAVIERYLSGDKQGRDSNGFPIDLYPPGWTRAINRYDKNKVDGEVSPGEADTIRRLMTTAIEQGVIECFDNREIEHEFQVTLSKLPCWKCSGAGKLTCNTCRGSGSICGKCAAHLSVDDSGSVCDTYHRDADVSCPVCGGDQTCPVCKGDGKGDHIQIKGFIDYLLPDGIQDHKSSGRVKYWKSKDALRENTQMLIYAKILMLLIQEASAEGVKGRPLASFAVPEQISLRHNQFCSDPNEPRVRKKSKSSLRTRR